MKTLQLLQKKTKKKQTEKQRQHKKVSFFSNILYIEDSSYFHFIFPVYMYLY